ncbi:hypothetical protein HDU98_010052 [Podochytrium sp. JEL0797]|nr:hypothetical protein HDU98_010052 [Podochytrium sp. JEL0797]
MVNPPSTDSALAFWVAQFLHQGIPQHMLLKALRHQLAIHRAFPQTRQKTLSSLWIFISRFVPDQFRKQTLLHWRWAFPAALTENDTFIGTALPKVNLSSGGTSMVVVFVTTSRGHRFGNKKAFFQGLEEFSGIRENKQAACIESQGS